MYDRLNETQFIQILTSYLQYFKSYFSLTFSLIEVHLFPSKFNPKQLKSFLQKIINKKILIKFSFSPFLLELKEYNKSFIDRFHIRMTEFLEYRFSPFKNADLDTKLTNIIRNFINKLHQAFNQMNISSTQSNKQKNISSVGELLVRIEQIIKRFFTNLFQYLQKTHQNSQIFLEQLNYSWQVVQQYVFKTLQNNLAIIFQQNDTIDTHDEGKKTFVRRFFKQQNSTLYHFKCQSQFILQPFYEIFPRKNRQSQEKIPDCLSLRNLQQIKSQKQGYQPIKSLNDRQKKKKESYFSMLSIIQIENAEVFSRDYILQDLRNKNLRNKILINQFIKHCKRKQRKHERQNSRPLQGQNFIEIDQETLSEKASNKVKQADSKINEAVSLEQISSNKKVLHACSPGRLVSIQQMLPGRFNSETIREKVMTNSETIREKVMNKPILDPINQFQKNKDSFVYKQREKIYFQSLKKQTNSNHKEADSKKKDTNFSQVQSSNARLNISTPRFVGLEQSLSPRFYKNFRKKGLAKISNLSSYISEKIGGLLDKSQNKNNRQSAKKQVIFFDRLETRSEIKGSELSRAVHRRKKHEQSLEFELNKSGVENNSKTPEKAIKKVFESESSVVILPKISSTKKQQNNNK